MNSEILNKSMIGKDFLLLKDRTRVTINEILDYRNYWVNRKTKCRVKDYSRHIHIEIFQLEIDAADEILKTITP